MIEFHRFDKFTNPLNEAKQNRKIIDKLIEENPDLFAVHSNTSRVKNVNSITVEEFEQKIQQTLKISKTQIVHPPKSGSSKFPSVAFEYEGDKYNFILAGGHVASKGHGFEYKLQDDLEKLAEIGGFSENTYTYPGIIKDIIKEFKITDNLLPSLTFQRVKDCLSRLKVAFSAKAEVLYTGKDIEIWAKEDEKSTQD